MARSNATIENHCQRERCNRSRRPGNRNKSLNVSFPFGLAGTHARRHATAKNPARIASASIMGRLIGSLRALGDRQTSKSQNQRQLIIGPTSSIGQRSAWTPRRVGEIYESERCSPLLQIREVKASL